MSDQRTDQTSYRPSDAPPHSQIWQQIHDLDKRLTLNENLIMTLNANIMSVSTKHGAQDVELSKLTTLFQDFIDRFDDHLEQNRTFQAKNEAKIQRFVEFQVKLNMIWRVVGVCTAAAVIIIGGIYTLNKDTGFLNPKPYIESHSSNNPGH